MLRFNYSIDHSFIYSFIHVHSCVYIYLAVHDNSRHCAFEVIQDLPNGHQEYHVRAPIAFAVNRGSDCDYPETGTWTVASTSIFPNTAHRTG